MPPSAYGDRELMADVLYCLDSAGVGDLKAPFPGDHAAAFRRIDAERERRRKVSPAYRAVTAPGSSDANKPTPER